LTILRFVIGILDGVERHNVSMLPGNAVPRERVPTRFAALRLLSAAYGQASVFLPGA
jgi:hypothetical protein